MDSKKCGKDFIVEVLKWTLDCDTIQNFLIDVSDNMGISKEDAINYIKEMADDGLLKIFDSDNGSKNGKFVDLKELNVKYIESHKYTDMVSTDITLSYIKKLLNESDRNGN